MMIKKKKVIAGSMNFARNTNTSCGLAFLIQPMQVTFWAINLYLEDQE